MAALAVIVAAMAVFGAGAAWYVTLAQLWLRVSGVRLRADGQPVATGSKLPPALSFLAAVLLTALLQHLLTRMGVTGPLASAAYGAGLGAFAIAPFLALNHAYCGRSQLASLIDGGYAVLAGATAGLILGLF